MTTFAPESTLTTLVDELRGIGVGVSVGEHLDAARALASIPLADRETVRASLQCALVKRAEHLDAFNLLFDLHFSGTEEPGSQPLAGLSADELQAALRAALASGDAAELRLVAEEYVRRYAALEPGAPVAGVFAMIAATEAANLEALRADGQRLPVILLTTFDDHELLRRAAAAGISVARVPPEAALRRFAPAGQKYRGSTACDR